MEGEKPKPYKHGGAQQPPNSKGISNMNPNRSSNVLASLKASETKMVLAGSPLLAAFVSVDLHGKSKREEVRQVFIKHNFRDIARSHIPAVSATQALRKSVTMSKPSGGMSVSEFINPSNSPLAFGVYFIPSEEATEQSEKGDKHVCGARVRVNPETNSVEALPPEGKSVEEAHGGCLNYARSIAGKATALVENAETSDITSALASVLGTMFALKLSQHGRGHIILPKYLSRWTALLDSLAPFGVRGRMLSLWDLPDHKAEACEAGRDAFIGKIRELRERAVEMVKKTGANKKGPRGDSLQNTLCDCTNLANEAKLYGDILGDLREGIEKDVAEIRKVVDALVSGRTVSYSDSDAEKPTSIDLPEFDAEQVAADLGLDSTDRVIPEQG